MPKNLPWVFGFGRVLVISRHGSVWSIADFQVCRVVGFQTRWPQVREADLEVGDTAGLETCATMAWISRTAGREVDLGLTQQVQPPMRVYESSAKVEYFCGVSARSGAAAKRSRARQRWVMPVTGEPG